MAKMVSLVIKFGALAFVIGLPLQYAIELQLLGGVWIIQTLPSVIGGLYTRWFHDRALFLGWLAGIVAGTAMAASQAVQADLPAAPRRLDDPALRRPRLAGRQPDRRHRADPDLHRHQRRPRPRRNRSRPLRVRS